VYLVLRCTIGITRRSLGFTPGYQSGFIHGIFIFKQQIWFLRFNYHLSVKLKTLDIFEDYKRGVCLDNLDVGLDWSALIRTTLNSSNLLGLLVQS